MSGGGFTLRFHPELNRGYRIEYSPDLIHWNRAAQTVIGTGSAIRWTDDGPPKTTPALEAGRYDRVVPVPRMGREDSRCAHPDRYPASDIAEITPDGPSVPGR